MNEETQIMEKFAEKIIQAVTENFTNKIEGVRSDLTGKIEELREQNKRLEQKVDAGFEMMHTQINTVEENLTSRIQGVENRMDHEVSVRADNYVKKEEHEKLEKRVKTIEGTLKVA